MIKVKVTNRIAVVTDHSNEPMITINLRSNPQAFDLLLLLDQTGALDLEFETDTTDQRILKHVRESKGLTLEQLAELVGCSRQSIAKIENGTSEPKLSLAIRIADALNIDVRDII